MTETKGKNVNMEGLMGMKEASAFLHVSYSTLRRWEREGLLPVYKTEGGHRRFLKEDLLRVVGARGYRIAKKLTIGYCRVSTASQKEDLERQKEVVSKYCEKNGYKYRIITDVGSGINYKKKGLQELLMLVCSGDIERIVINYKDRIMRFGYEMFEEICRMNDVEIEIINSTDDISEEEELVQDVLSIITVFSSRLYGNRSHKNKQIVEENKRLFTRKDN